MYKVRLPCVPNRGGSNHVHSVLWDHSPNILINMTYINVVFNFIVTLFRSEIRMITLCGKNKKMNKPWTN